MTSSQVKARFLSDHGKLRGKAAVLEALALGILRGDTELTSALRLKGEELQSHLLVHMEWEEEELLPLLRHRPGSGSKAAEAMLNEHRKQRKRLAATLVTLQTTEETPNDLARHFLDFVRWLETDMAGEETDVLLAIT